MPRRGSLAARDTDRITPISNVFWLWWGFARARVAHIGLVLGPTSAPDAPTQDQVAHAKPNLRPNVPKLRHVGPQLGSSWAQAGPKLEPTGPSSAQVKRPKVGRKWAPVRPNLRPRTAKFDPSRLLVGPSRPASFLRLAIHPNHPFSLRSWCLTSTLAAWESRDLSSCWGQVSLSYSLGAGGSRREATRIIQGEEKAVCNSLSQCKYLHIPNQKRSIYKSISASAETHQQGFWSLLVLKLAQALRHALGATCQVPESAPSDAKSWTFHNLPIQPRCDTVRPHFPARSGTAGDETCHWRKFPQAKSTGTHGLYRVTPPNLAFSCKSSLETDSGNDSSSHKWLPGAQSGNLLLLNGGQLLFCLLHLLLQLRIAHAIPLLRIKPGF